MHATRIGAVVGFGEAEATEPLAGSQLGQVFTALFFAAEGVDRVHHQRALHRSRGAHARVAPLDLLHNQPVGDVVEAAPAVFGGNGGAERPDFTKLLDHEGRKLGPLRVFFDDGRNLALHKVAQGMSDELVLLGEQVVDGVKIGRFEGVLTRFAGW